MKRITGITASFLVTVIAGCGSAPITPIQDARAIVSTFEVGKDYQVSVGEIIADSYSGAWRRTFTTREEIRFAELDPIPPGTQFTARYIHNESGRLVLVSPQFDEEQIAVQCARDGSVTSADEAIQVAGARPGRLWKLVSPAGQLLQPNGFWADDETFPGIQSGWKLQYIGFQGSLLRFTIQELGLDKQRMGQVEYTHDMNASREFVFRGTRLQIDNLDRDGTLRFTTLAQR